MNQGANCPSLDHSGGRGKEEKQEGNIVEQCSQCVRVHFSPSSFIISAVLAVQPPAKW